VSVIRQVKNALDLKLVIGDAVVVEVCSVIMAERSKYFKGLVAHNMAEQNNGTVDLTQICLERSLLPVDIEWVVGSVEKGQALPLPDQEEGKEGTPVLIRLLRASNYFGAWGSRGGSSVAPCCRTYSSCHSRLHGLALTVGSAVGVGGRCGSSQVARGGSGGGGAHGGERDGRAARGQGL
jgi:hypothetical protein